MTVRPKTDMLEMILNSKVGGVLGMSVVFIASTWIVWDKFNEQIDGRLEAQDSRIGEMVAEVNYLREYIKEEQQHRALVFTAIKEHLADIAKGRN
jgi:hypothetical protein